ncbi:uncharacterized protein K460DRAFT_365082 [Cucurbitaria berberidis CBS 394.84]|uniref:Uncharacterized protein n=1 Tax=Cucurbitaria berberidis CBS 394.84 TaxID=1168544 RepID=A0A9P4LCA6_9PLEO|nr:uncharacterized protein K460DRAFT_365082 [Cucurbitaria berberidis CBS 394.84]KAF1849172.1 hypothetical protein K460DRAFT_365082 [Cucurbitaria berberidis CBS 394.84]
MIIPTSPTLQLQETELAQPKPAIIIQEKHDEYLNTLAGLSSHRAMHNGVVPSMLHAGDFALSIGKLFGQDQLDHETVFTAQFGRTNPNHENAPSDGDVVWFCSSCGDGPIGSWQVCCPVCTHQKCGGCRVEQT